MPAPNRSPRAVHVVQQPGHFRAAEIGVQQKPRAFGHHGLMPLGLEPLAQCGGAPVLPDNRVMDGLAGLAVPDQRGFPLIGDADPGDLFGLDPGLLHHRAAGAGRRGPKVRRIMFDPARGRVMLGKLFLRHGCHAQVTVKQDRAAGCGALIDGQNIAHLSPLGLVA